MKWDKIPISLAGVAYLSLYAPTNIISFLQIWMIGTSILSPNAFVISCLLCVQEQVMKSSGSWSTQ